MHSHRNLHLSPRIHRHLEVWPEQAKNASSLVFFDKRFYSSSCMCRIQKNRVLFLATGNVLFIVNLNQIFSICWLVFLCSEGVRLDRFICSYSSFNMVYWSHFMDEETDPVTEDGEVEIYGLRKKARIVLYESTSFFSPNCHAEPKCFLFLVFLY